LDIQNQILYRPFFNCAIAYAVFFKIRLWKKKIESLGEINLNNYTTLAGWGLGFGVWGL
jgi:hypothetical protein